MPIRLLIVLADETAQEEAGGPELSCLAPVYYLFRDAGAEVVLASPSGGHPALRLRPAAEGAAAPAVARFLADRAARDALADTLSLSQIVPEDFDAAFCLGHHGTLQATGAGVGAQDAAAPGALLATLLAAGVPVGLLPGAGARPGPRGAGEGLLILGETPRAARQAGWLLLALARGDAGA
ncbi:transporter [Oceanicella sp. SM1341]|uniref:transporter n=1 Tax=Oceanicella sp. SM1341 TaxID=1548889 RepID=UPI0013009992|nr:transporter [Oceanicella sp. SM1341]